MIFEPAVILVDDDIRLLRSFKRLAGNDIRILTANSGPMALQIIHDCEDCRIVISDLRMPGMDGIELLNAVRKRSPAIVRIMLTGQADLRDAARSINECGVHRLLIKPVDPITFRETIQQAFEQYNINLAALKYPLSPQVDELLLPVCAYCKKIRHPGAPSRDPESWAEMERYLAHHFGVILTHGICPDCLHKLDEDDPD